VCVCVCVCVRYDPCTNRCLEYRQIIISEMHLPTDRKTIKNCDAGGIAGGEKYICHSIFFKFAIDSYISNANIWMYGGATRNDTAAMKGAGLDLQGLMSYYDIKVPGLHFPLMALIDYRYATLQVVVASMIGGLIG
jgi:hypothetical protein